MTTPVATTCAWDEVDLNLLNCVMVCTRGSSWRQKGQIFNQVNDILGRPRRTEHAMQMQWRRATAREQSQVAPRPRRSRNGSQPNLRVPHVRTRSTKRGAMLTVCTAAPSEYRLLCPECVSIVRWNHTVCCRESVCGCNVRGPYCQQQQQCPTDRRWIWVAGLCLCRPIVSARSTCPMGL